MRTERPISRAASTINNQDGWRPASGIARIQGTASRLMSTASQQKALSRTMTPPRLDTQVSRSCFKKSILKETREIFHEIIDERDRSLNYPTRPQQ